MVQKLVTDDSQQLRQDATDPAEAVSDSAPSQSLRSKIAKQFVGTVGVAFLIVVLQMGQGILLARSLGPTGRGEYATAMFVVQLLLYIGMFGGLEVICRHAAEAKFDAERLRRAALKLGLTTGLATTGVAIVLNVVALPADKRYLMPLAFICALSLTGQQVLLIMTGIDRGQGRFGTYNLRRVIGAAAFPVLLLATELAMGVTLLTACVLFVIASIVSMAVCIYGLRMPLRGPSAPSVPGLIKESRPYAYSMFATDLFERLDLLLILWIAGLRDQGFYAAMVPVAYPLTVIPNTMGLFLFNAAAGRKNRLQIIDVHRILGGSIAVQTVCTIVFMLLIAWVIEWLYGAEFVPAVHFAYWLAPVAAIKGILQGLDSYVKGRGQPLAAIRCRLIAMATMVLVAILLQPYYGAIAVAIAALVGQVLCLVWLSAIVYTDVARQQSESDLTIDHQNPAM
ncbi:lipopolysaccharide biosynthesis protein [Stieleria sp. JC731]|uniref:lipopolysaccharide biosynthesis protein n=1 Tax=Pirellulaceae TaxID=2691357 RepID=UPI001E5F3597|nr:lipopolysaccharide biosynthesis protein [Stieleria sp. JC731]MCC9599763.1 lipopolysaccharide biosynthesis protein [Stieleria sp. JC731]